MSAGSTTTLQCEKCGEALAKNSPGGLCPRCLMGSVFSDDPTSAIPDGEEGDQDVATIPNSGMPGAPDPLEGTRIGDYKLLQRIGEGGFGLVYMAEQVEHVHRKAAIKIIKAGMDTRQVIARFEAERQALAMMEHPNIARVLDVGETEEGLPYFVMELVKGIPITTYCHEEKLPTEVRLRLFMQVCSAVQHAHMKGIIHRDLKPSNVLVTLHDGDPVPKVIDFGIAKAMDTRLTDKTLFTRYEHMIGTPAYMSPEQAALSGLDVDTRSDVYALGVLLYELLTGTTPFDSETLRQAAFDEMRRMIREDEPPKPSTRLTNLKATRETPKTAQPIPQGSAIARELDWIAMKTLEKDRGRRYETATGLAEDLERYLRNEPVVAGPPGVRYKLGKFVRRNRRAVVAAACMVVALVGGMTLAMWGMVQARKAEEEAQKQEFIARQNARAAQKASNRASEEAQRAQAAEKNAQAEAEIAAAINTFLREDLLLQASPEETADPDIKLRTVLNRASKLVGDRFKKQPLVEAEMRMTLAQTFFAIQDDESVDAGIAHVEEATEVLRQHFGEDHPRTLRAKSLFCTYYLLPKNVPPRERLERLDELRKVLDAQTQLLGRDHPDTIRTAARLGRHLHQKDAIALQALLESLPKIGDTQDPQIIDALIYFRHLNGGSLQINAEDWRSYKDWSVRNLGPSHPTTLSLIGHLSRRLFLDQNYEEVIELLSVSVYKDQQLFGLQTPREYGIRMLAASLFKVGRIEEAQELLAEQFRAMVEEEGELDLDSVLILTPLMHITDLDTWLREWDPRIESIRTRLTGIPLDQATLIDANRLFYLAGFYWHLSRRKTTPEWRDPEGRLPLGADPQGIWGEGKESIRQGFVTRGIRTAERALEVFRKCPKTPLFLNGSNYGQCLWTLGLYYRRLAEAGDSKLLYRQSFGIALEELLFRVQQAGRESPPIDDPSRDYLALDCLPVLSHGLPSRATKLFLDLAARLAEYQQGKLLLEQILPERGLNDSISYGLLQKTAEFLASRGDDVIAEELVDQALERFGQDSAYRNDLAKDATLAEWLRPHLYERIEYPRYWRDDLGHLNRELWLPEGVQTIVDATASWNYLCPADGIDPAVTDYDFHQTFANRDFDDSMWKSGRDGPGDDGGFGYGDPAGTQWELPEPGKRFSAYLRHKFTTSEPLEKLWLKLSYDDAVIIYLDGVEVQRLRIPHQGTEHFQLPSHVSPNDERHLKVTTLKARLEPGEHVLAISLHNRSPISSDLRIGEITLLGLAAQTDTQ